MTDKEQIACDCKYCMENPTCYKELLEEQLTLKTQECDELKEKIKKLTIEYDRENLHNVDLAFKYYQIEKANQRQTKIANDLGKNMLKYEQALEKIEGLVKNFCKDCDDYGDCNWDKEGCYYSLIPNLKDIINNAKEEE